MTDRYRYDAPVTFQGNDIALAELLDVLYAVVVKGGDATFADGGAIDVAELGVFLRCWDTLAGVGLEDSAGGASFGAVLHSIANGQATLHSYTTEAAARTEALFKDEPTDSHQEAVDISKWCSELAAKTRRPSA
jgi:hypothetical protein